MPKLDGDLVVVTAKREIAQHLEVSQVRSIADQTEIVGADAGLQRSLATTVRIVETAFELLHPAANEERGLVMFGDDVAINNERKIELLEAASDYVERAKRRVIWLSSLVGLIWLSA